MLPEAPRGLDRVHRAASGLGKKNSPQDFFFFVIFLHLEGQVSHWAEGLLRPGQASKGT